MKGARRWLVLASAGVAALSAGACGPSKWEMTFKPDGLAVAPLASAEPVKVREVAWERLDGALRELEAERAASDAPPDEWAPERQEAARAKLLRALQVTADPSRVRFLGRSTFRTTSRTDPDGAELAAFARRIGADTVVWSSNYLGKTQIIRDEPVSEWRTGSLHGRHRSDTFTETSTIWVPVVVEADEHAYMAYYLKHLDGPGSITPDASARPSNPP